MSPVITNASRRDSLQSTPDVERNRSSAEPAADHRGTALSSSFQADRADLQSRLQILFLSRKGIALSRPLEMEMADDVLESYIRQYIAVAGRREISFAWQGGEPTLLGVDFFRKVVEMQKRYADGKTHSQRAPDQRHAARR